jgi:hypothetical protein
MLKLGKRPDAKNGYLKYDTKLEDIRVEEEAKR